MPKDIPGFYFDQEKNRYFPIKGPLPGSSRKTAPPKQPVMQLKKVQGASSKVFRTVKLLQGRELFGSMLYAQKTKICFQDQCEKNLVSRPEVWRYQGTELDCNGALGVMRVKVETSIGMYETEALLTGGVDGSLSIFDTEREEDGSIAGSRRTAEHFWPDPPSKQPLNCNSGKDIVKLTGDSARVRLPSRVSCICMRSMDSSNVASNPGRVFITTLGSESSRGSLYVLDDSDPLHFNEAELAGFAIMDRLHMVAQLRCSIWTADSTLDGSKVVIGTDRGAILLNAETGDQSVLCRCKSDVLSLQLLQSGNVVLCGFRNGTILAVDARERPQELPRHRLSYPHPSTASSRTTMRGYKERFEVRGNIISPNIHMPSSISCLSTLQLYDQYFLASSMDGSVRLYDHRLVQRGPVQSYHGHVNSHTRIQLGVDPFERFVMTGGEDRYMRVWSIKSGEMLFEDKVMNSIPMTCCTQQGSPEPRANVDHDNEIMRKWDCSWGAWLGSNEGLFWMQFG